MAAFLASKYCVFLGPMEIYLVRIFKVRPGVFASQLILTNHIDLGIIIMDWKINSPNINQPAFLVVRLLSLLGCSP